MKRFFQNIKPKKVLVCKACKAKFQFPVKPGKTLKVTCPKCRTSYQVAFVNPLIELVKGRLKWGALSRSEKRNLIIVFISLLVCLGLILSSAARPIKPNIQVKNQLSYVI